MEPVNIASKTLPDRFREYGHHCLNGGFIFDDQSGPALEKIFELLINSNLGIVLAGNSGSGKSIIFEILLRVIHPQEPEKFSRYSCDAIVKDFNENGSSALSVFDQRKHLHLDELGLERPGDHYREHTEVLERGIMQRYYVWKDYGFKTHFTTNLGEKKIEKRYGFTALHRMKEMTEIVNIGASVEYINRRELKNFKGYPPVNHRRIWTEDEINYNKGYRQAMRLISEGWKPVPAADGAIGSILKSNIDRRFRK